MADREKVISDLDEQIAWIRDNDFYKFPGWGHTVLAMRDALALLKAHDPRVMTWQEVIGAAIECKPLYVEVKDSEDKEPGDDRWAMVTQYKDSITNGMIRAMSSYVTSEVLFAEDYGKRWRCWTSRPTKEQMEALKWE